MTGSTSGAAAFGRIAWLLWIALAWVAPLPAAAHAVLMDSSPKAAQVLASSPTEVSVTFNESVGPIFFKILDKTGKEVGKPGEIKLDGVKMIMPLGDTLPNGTYVLTYRVISADTHPVGSTFGFSIGEPMADLATMAAAADQGRSGWTWPVAANRWILYATMLLAAGSALFVLLLGPPQPLVEVALRAGRGAALVAAVAYVLAIGLGGAEMLTGGPGVLFSAAAWSRGLESTLTSSAVIGVPAMLLLWWAMRRTGGRPGTALLALGAAAAVGSFLVTGHAATAPPVWLMATAVGLHLFGTAFWLGSLYPLYRGTELPSVRAAGGLMTQFSRWAVWAVGAIVLSGIIISWTQLQSLGNFVGNDYGISLLVKLGLFLAIIGIAAYNKQVLTPALERNEPAAVEGFRRSIRIEYAVYVLIVGAAMALTLSTPPRAIVQAGAGGGAMAGMMDNGIRKSVKAASGYSVDIDLTPGKAGENMIMATVKDADGKVLTEMADLEIIASLESAGISELRVKGEKMPDGMWHVMVSDMLIPGKWALEIDAFITDYDKVEFSTEVDIK